MNDGFLRIMTLLRYAYAVRCEEATIRMVAAPNTSLVNAVMDDVFFASLEDGWRGFAKTAYSFSAMACMAAAVLFLVSGTLGQGTFVERAISGLLEDPAGLFALYYLEF